MNLKIQWEMSGKDDSKMTHFRENCARISRLQSMLTVVQHHWRRHSNSGLSQRQQQEEEYLLSAEEQIPFP